MVHLRHCPACGAPSSDATCVLASGRSYEGRPFTSRIFRCRCGHGFLNPQPTFVELIAFYDDDYHGFVFPTNKEEFETWLSQVRQGDRLNHVRIKPGGRFLDIGCGGGLMVAGMARVGMEAEGLEPSQFAASRAREAGLNVRCGLLHEVAYPAERFDAISISHVLEHIEDPREILRECRRILKPGGELVIGVPNFDSLVFALVHKSWIGLQLPTHLHHFSVNSLRMLAESTGFIVESVETNSTKEAVVYELATWLRQRLLLPKRLTVRSKLLGHWASRLARRGEANGRGEVILMHLVAP
jgi:2-polyprenyl-3-methyl-5-hydroxy-6-metoxy-1,4-benzoquinol methylase